MIVKGKELMYTYKKYKIIIFFRYFCRAVEYDDSLKRCIIFEEDSVSQKDDVKQSNSPSHDLYDLVCLDNGISTSLIINKNYHQKYVKDLIYCFLFIVKGNELSDSPATSPLFQEGRRPDTAFQRYRLSKLAGEFELTEITGRSLSECLDECLRQVSFQCRSAVYSERFRICRLSRLNQADGRLTYDPDYDYYENLMGIFDSINPRTEEIEHFLMYEFFLFQELEAVHDRMS